MFSTSNHQVIPMRYRRPKPSIRRRMFRNSIRKSASFSPQLETLEDKRLLTAIEVVTERAYLNANFNAFDHDLDASLNLADVDADGNTDLFAFGNGTCTLWLGDGSGNWTQETSFTVL